MLFCSKNIRDPSESHYLYVLSDFGKSGFSTSAKKKKTKNGKKSSSVQKSCWCRLADKSREITLCLSLRTFPNNKNNSDIGYIKNMYYELYLITYCVKNVDYDSMIYAFLKNQKRLFLLLFEIKYLQSFLTVIAPGSK